MDYNDYDSYLNRTLMMSLVRLGMAIYRNNSREELDSSNFLIQKSARKDFYHIVIENVTIKDEGRYSCDRKITDCKMGECISEF